jgi:uncharacterized damage-inducible protein DinB
MDIQKELIAEYERETANTRKMLEAIPENADFNWQPHAKSMKLGKLAGHVADTNGDWALHTLNRDRLDWNPEMNSPDPANRGELLARFEKQVAEVSPALAAMTPAKWDSNWKFVAGEQTWIDDTKYNVWRTWVMNHLVHHRAQLGVYLRMLDQKIPGTYGPSADEM